eukprot:Gb_02680 [translate_table: standard]
MRELLDKFEVSEEAKEVYRKEKQPRNTCLDTPKFDFSGLEYIFKEIKIRHTHNNEEKTKEEKSEYEESQGRDTQEEITEDQTYKPMIDDQEGVTRDKALEVQGKEYKEKQDEEKEDYNLRYYYFDDQKDARFYEILTPKDPQLVSISVATTMVPSESTYALLNKPIHKLDQLPIKKELEDEEQVEINYGAIPVDASELDFKTSDIQDVILSCEEICIKPKKEIKGSSMKPKIDSSLFNSTKEDVRLAPFGFSRRTCIDGTKGPEVINWAKEPIMMHDFAITKNYVMVPDQQKMRPSINDKHYGALKNWGEQGKLPMNNWRNKRSKKLTKDT